MRNDVVHGAVAALSGCAAATPCDGTIPGTVVLSDALVVTAGGNRSVLIAGDPDIDKAFALDPTSCVVVMTGR